MKTMRNAIACAIVCAALTACFSDEGNYTYESLKPPTWLINVNNEPIYVYGRGGEETNIDASRYFNWGKLDSLERSKEVRYEWRLNGKVFSTELKETIPTDEFMKRLGLTDYPTGSFDGDFAIIEKATGISFKARTYITIEPPIAECDFIVYSAKNNSDPHIGSMSALSLKYGRAANGTFSVPKFIFKKHLSDDIPGTPKRMDVSLSLNVSPTGSVTAITQEGDAVVLNASTLKKVWELGSQFADGTPANFKVSARRDQEIDADNPAFTWVATQDGRIFTRQTGKHYLGGKFLTEPYYLDEKGYKITNFGHTLWGHTNIPCYDEKNRRVLIATSLEGNYHSYRVFMTDLSMPGWAGAPIMKMPADAEVFYLTAINGQMYWDRNNSWYQIWYNTGGKSMVGTFAVDNRTRKLNVPMANTYYFPYEVTGHLLNKETVFLTAATTRLSNLKSRCDLFSEGNKVFVVVRSGTWGATSIDQIGQLPLKGITSKVTAMTYDRNDQYTQGRDYKHLLVGCENGDVLIYEVTNLPAPVLVGKYNAGGRVASIKQLRAERTTLDMY